MKPVVSDDLAIETAVGAAAPEISRLFEDPKIRDNEPGQMETHPSVDLAKVATSTDVRTRKSSVKQVLDSRKASRA